MLCVLFFFQAEDGIRDLVRSRGLGDVYKRQARHGGDLGVVQPGRLPLSLELTLMQLEVGEIAPLSLIHI